MASPFRNSLDSPYCNGAAVTPSDADELPEPARALWVGGAGNLKVTLYGGDVVTLVGVAAGTMIRDLPCIKVWNTDTTATSILMLC